MTTLEEILAYKKEEIAHKKEMIPFEKLRSYVFNHAIATRKFTEGLLHPQLGDIGLIAEIKIASPIAGKLGEAEDGIERATLYEYGGADAISVVVDKKFFHGDPALIGYLKEEITLPILAKDFVIDEYQLFEAKSVGADAVLLIAKIVELGQLDKFIKLAMMLGMEPIVEINTEEDLAVAVKTEGPCIAVNARNLSDFSVDTDQAVTLLRQIPRDRIAMGFSGVKTRADIEAYKKAGAKAVLVGTSLMKAPDVVAMIKDLKRI